MVLKWLAMLLLGFLAVAAQAQEGIVPGCSLEGVTLGMPRTDVWKHIGKPNEIHSYRFANQSYIEEYRQDNQQIDMVILREGKVVQVQRDLIHNNPVMVTFSSIRRQHPHLKIRFYDHGGDVGSDLLLDDIQHGIAWKIYIWHEELTYLHSFSKSEANWVIIHRPGQPALPSVGQKPIINALLLHNLRAWFAAKPQAQKGN